MAVTEGEPVVLTSVTRSSLVKPEWVEQRRIKATDDGDPRTKTMWVIEMGVPGSNPVVKVP